MQNIYLVKKNYANPPEGDTKPPEDSASMKFVYHQLNHEKSKRGYNARRITNFAPDEHKKAFILKIIEINDYRHSLESGSTWIEGPYLSL